MLVQIATKASCRVSLLCLAIAGAIHAQGRTHVAHQAQVAGGGVPGASGQVVRMGSNPLALFPGVTSAPLLGATWDPVVRLERPLAAPSFVLLALGPPAQVPTRMGDVLFTPPAVLTSVRALGAPHPFAIPLDGALLGTRLVAQGGWLDGGALQLTNALDVTLGSLIPMTIEGCSLGCVQAAGQVSCSVTEVSVNAPLFVEFSNALDFSSVSNQSVRIFNVATGANASGTFSVVADSPNTLKFLPMLGFDPDYRPIFGLHDGATYQLHIPGEVFDSGPFLRDLDGQSNQTRLTCTVVASLGVADLEPGPPIATINVRVVASYDPVTGLPATLATVPAEGAIEVYLATSIDLRFNDLLDLSTVLEPGNKTSPSVSIFVDADRDLGTEGDQTAISGAFEVDLFFVSMNTAITFRPFEELPQASLVVVRLAPTIQDAAGNALENPGTISFVTEDRVP